MSQRNNYAVNGFYPWPVPVSLSGEAAVFVCGKTLYRVDSQLNALRRTFSGEITQVVQTEHGVFALEWTSQGEAALLKLDSRLRTADRRVFLWSGPADLDRLPDPYDLEDWRNQKELCLLTDRWLYRLSAQGDQGDMIDALILDCTPLEGGETVRHVIGGSEIERALGGGSRFNNFELRPGDDTMWAHGNQVFLHVTVWDWARHLMLQIGVDGSLVVLWDSPDVLDGRPCFFDFDRDMMWTCAQPGEAAYPEEAQRRRYLPLVARRIAPGAPVLSDFPVWEDIDPFQPYFDGVHELSGVEESLLVLWKDRLLLDLEGQPVVCSLQTKRPVGGELLKFE